MPRPLRHRLASVLAVASIGGGLFAPGTAFAAAPTVTFRGGCGLLGVGASSRPDIGALTVAPGSAVTFVNRLGQSADLMINGADRATVPADSQIGVVFRQGRLSVSLVPACLLGNGGAGSVTVTVRSAGNPGGCRVTVLTRLRGASSSSSSVWSFLPRSHPGRRTGRPAALYFSGQVSWSGLPRRLSCRGDGRRQTSCHGKTVAVSPEEVSSLASLRDHGDPRRQPGGAHRRSVSRHVPQRDPDRGWLGGEARRLAPQAPVVRAQQKVRGQLRGHRPAADPVGGSGAGPAVAT